MTSRYTTAPLRIGASALLAAILCCASADLADAQCVGDCDGNGQVKINELVNGVNIALNVNPVTNCPAFDGNNNGSVSVSELVTGVNNALSGCPGGPTPTPTTPTGGSPTPTPTEGTVTPGCGNGVVEFDLGETCDDGNTMDGDNCPATCKIRDCQFSAATIDIDVTAQGPADMVLGALQVFLRYPDGVIALPSSGAQAAIAISNLPDDAFSTSVNDLDYAVRVVSVGPDGLTLAADPPNRFFTAQFTRCEGAALPAASDFTCKVENATLVEGTDVTTQTTCAVRLP